MSRRITDSGFILNRWQWGGDLIHVPSEENWNKHAPTWAQGKYEKLISEMKRVAWNRKIEWRVMPEASLNWSRPPIPPGSIESTSAGRWLESRRLFQPGNRLSDVEVREAWHDIVRRFCRKCSGTVRVNEKSIIKNSVFELIEIPELKRNKKVVLVMC